MELKDGQSFAIAGLFRDDITQTVSKLPLLGDIPILGALFRSTNFQNKKTELVIVVTPEVVKPGVGAPPKTLPGEFMRPPDEFATYLLGEMASSPAKENQGIPRSLGELEGKFGHAMVY